MMENSSLKQVEFRACAMSLRSQIEDCFVTHVWCALSFFFRDGKFLVEEAGILSLCNVA